MKFHPSQIENELFSLLTHELGVKQLMRGEPRIQHAIKQYKL